MIMEHSIDKEKWKETTKKYKNKKKRDGGRKKECKQEVEKRKGRGRRRREIDEYEKGLEEAHRQETLTHCRWGWHLHTCHGHCDLSLITAFIHRCLHKGLATKESVTITNAYPFP